MTTALVWSPVPVQRSRGHADEDLRMAKLVRDERDRWTLIDYLAACSRVVDVLINAYLGLGPGWRKPPLRKRIRRAWQGPKAR